MKALAKVQLPLIAAASMALGLAGAPARAADTRPAAATATSSGTSNVQQLNEEGAALYGARDYRRAIEKFIQAYAVDTDPNLLFNIARCYEELGEIDAAIEKYEVFLKTPGADARGRQRARDALRVLKESKNSTASVAPAPLASPSAAPESQLTNTGNTGDSAGGQSVLPWLTLGGSVVFAAVGTTFYILGAGDHADVTDAAGFDDPNAVSPMTRREADDLVSSGNTKKLVGGISLGVAGALAVTYVALILSEDDDEEVAEPSLGFSLSPNRSGGAVSVQGSF